MTTDDVKWIAHNGAPCPLVYGTPILVRFRSGREINTLAKTRDDNETWTWPYGEQANDIVAYRLHPNPCPIGLDNYPKNASYCSAGSCTLCVERRLAWKVEQEALPALPEGQHYELLNDEVVVSFDSLVYPDGDPPYTQKVLQERALRSLRDTANRARELKGYHWKYTTNGIMSNDLEEAADIFEKAMSDQMFLDRLQALLPELSGPYYSEINGFLDRVAEKLGLERDV